MYIIYGVIAGAIILGWIINKFDTKESKIKFVAKEMPHMKPYLWVQMVLVFGRV